MATARNLIKRAFFRARIATQGDTLSAQEYADAKEVMNGMLSAWSNDSLNIFTRGWETFDLVAGQSEYTMGVGGDFNTAKPIGVITGYIRDGSTDTDLAPITDEKYNSQIAYKDNQGLPYWFNFDGGHPIAKIRLYPAPSSSGYDVFLLTEKELTQYNLDDEVDLPAGWDEAIITGLAIKLAPEYGQPVDPEIRQQAKENLGQIRRAVMKTRSMDSDFGGAPTQNVNTGYRTR